MLKGEREVQMATEKIPGLSSACVLCSFRTVDFECDFANKAKVNRMAGDYETSLYKELQTMHELTDMVNKLPANCPLTR